MTMIIVPEREMSEERRLIIENMKHAYDMLDMAAKNSNKIFPGASANEFRNAWEKEPGPRSDLVRVANRLKEPTQDKFIPDDVLKNNGLTGSSGDLKRNFNERRRDEALRHLKPDKEWNIDTTFVGRRELKVGVEALGEYFEAAVTLFKSLVPHGEEVAEFLSYAGMLCKLGARMIGRRDEYGEN
jgi:hypothetical protein